MAVELKEGNNEQGILEFYFIELESYDDFVIIANILSQQHPIKLIEQLDGIYSRTATFEETTIGLFRLIYHEDAGTYAFSLDQSDKVNSHLRDILTKAVIEINQVRRPS
jgi:hypothetical protein